MAKKPRKPTPAAGEADPAPRNELLCAFPRDLYVAATAFADSRGEPLIYHIKLALRRHLDDLPDPAHFKLFIAGDQQADRVNKLLELPEDLMWALKTVCAARNEKPAHHARHALRRHLNDPPPPPAVTPMRQLQLPPAGRGGRG